jgi:hypothetical protein
LNSPPANGKQGQIPEEIYQNLLTNKKQGNPDRIHMAIIIKTMQTRINLEKYTFFIRAPKNLKTGCVPSRDSPFKICKSVFFGTFVSQRLAQEKGPQDNNQCRKKIHL